MQIKAAQKLLKEPILVTGCWRSGTSLLRSILRGHPSIYGLQYEPHYIREILQKYGLSIDNIQMAIKLITTHHKFSEKDVTQKTLFREFANDSEIPTRLFFQKVFALIMHDHPNQRLLLKDPRSSYYLHEMDALFPSIKVIGLVRDPRAVLASQIKLWSSRTLAQGVGFWKHALQNGERWGAQTGRYLLIRYEDLIMKPEATLQDICTFLKVAYSASIMQFQQPDNYHGRSRGFDQSRILSWQTYLQPEKIEYIQRRCRREMERHQYQLMKTDYKRSAFFNLVVREYYGQWRRPGVLTNTGKYRHTQRAKRV